ncbi:hypothetical protein M0802_011944 [Mischocyttarus mexicanus]|nr:hypothetical protein M0802_011944 [Mischocyttarus mexicanus]
MILLKSSFDIRRPPTVRLAHITNVSNKSKMTFSQLASVAKSNWGLSTKIINAIYKRVFIPVISEAAAGWVDKINVHLKKRLKQAQRYALIRVTKAYRTISIDALCMIVGATPVELLLVEIKNTYFLMRNIAFQHFDVSFAAQGQICKIETNNRKCTIRKTTTKIWKEQWNLNGQVGHFSQETLYLPDDPPCGEERYFSESSLLGGGLNALQHQV